MLFFYKDAKIRIGGLMRCCEATIEEFVANYGETPAEEGKLIDCMFEPKGNQQIIFRNGAFEWNNDKSNRQV